MSIRPVWLIVVGALWLSACIRDPDASSGGDAYRHQARPMEMDEWEIDDIAGSDGDRTDWRSVELAVPGRLQATARVDEPGTEVRVGIYDRYGRALHLSQGVAGQAEVTAVANVVRAERIFIMVQGTGGPPSAYNLRVTLGDGDASNSPKPGF